MICASALREPCKKRRFASVEEARRAHRRAGFRVRPYECPRCPGWLHVTAEDKRLNAIPSGPPERRRRKGKRGAPPPGRPMALTIEQEQAIVDRAHQEARRRRYEQGAR